MHLKWVSVYLCVALTLSSRPLQACAALPAGHVDKEAWNDVGGMMKGMMKFIFLQKLASDCGLPAGTVTLTPPALTTCEGAIDKFKSVDRCFLVSSCPHLSLSETRDSCHTVSRTALASWTHGSLLVPQSAQRRLAPSTTRPYPL
jgi:hypothetical protein